MSLFGKIFGGKDAPAPDPSNNAPSHRFAVDRDRMFDLALTSRLRALIDVPADRRDAAWTAEFYPALWNASIEVPENGNNPFMGPDRFDYLRIDMPAPGEFESNSLANLVDYCLDVGCGAALFPDPAAGEPAFVLPMGVLESLLVYGDPAGDPVDLEESEGDVASGEAHLPAGSEMLISTPSASFLSPASAHALDRFLRQEWGQARPAVALMANAELSPTRTLVLDAAETDFQDAETAGDFLDSVTWFLPPSRAVMLRPPDLDDMPMTPLAELYRRGR